MFYGIVLKKLSKSERDQTFENRSRQRPELSRVKAQLGQMYVEGAEGTQDLGC